MDALTQQLMQQLSGGGLSQIGKMIGADEKSTKTVLSAAVPVLVSALANNAAKPKGAQALQKALANDHDGSILDDISGFLKDPQAANGAGILGHILGARQPAVNQGLAKSSGLNIGQIAQLLQIAAPLIMGALGKKQQDEGLDTGGLTDFLGGQKQQAQQSNPDLMNVLGSLLGTGQGGSGLGNIIGALGKLFPKRQ
jgi:hypothetical protein